jgi:hypothetical protein
MHAFVLIQSAQNIITTLEVTQAKKCSYHQHQKDQKKSLVVCTNKLIR